MSFSFLIAAIRHFGALVASFVVLGFLAGFVYSSVMPKTYEATAQLVVELAPDSADAGNTDLSTNNQYVQQKLPTYVEFARSGQVLDAAREKLNISESTSYLTKHLEFAVPADTVVLSVTATWGSANEAAQVANAVAESFAKRVTKLDAAGAGPSDVSVNIFEPASAPEEPLGSTLVTLLVGALAGVVLGVVLALILKLRDPWSRTLPEIAIAADSDVLAVLSGDVEKQGERDNTTRRMQRETRRSTAVRSYAGLYARLGLADSSSRPRVLTAVAAEKGVDVGAVAWGLAQVAAASGVRALIATGDPRLQRYIAARCWASAAEGDAPLPELFPADGLGYPEDGVISTAKLNIALNEYAGSSDMVVIAAQAIGTDPSSRSCLDVADKVLLVASPRPRTDQLKMATELIRESGADIKGLVLTSGHSTAKVLQRISSTKQALEGVTP